jgi:hypothetical protein
VQQRLVRAGLALVLQAAVDLLLVVGDAGPGVEQLLRLAADELAQAGALVAGAARSWRLGAVGEDVGDEVELRAQSGGLEGAAGGGQCGDEVAARATVTPARPRARAGGEKGVTLVASTAR